MDIPEVPVPALIGRKEAARLFGIKPENLFRVIGLPRPLQDRKIKGFEVSTGPLWPRAEIEAAVKVEKARRRAVSREKLRAQAARVRDEKRRLAARTAAGR